MKIVCDNGIIVVFFVFVCVCYSVGLRAMRPFIPVSLLVSVSSGAGLYLVNKQCKRLEEVVDINPDDNRSTKELDKKHKIRIGLVCVTIVSALLMVYCIMTNKVPGSSSAPVSYPPRSTFGQEVANVASRLREQVSRSPPTHDPNIPTYTQAEVGTAELAAKASAEISEFIANNS